MSNEKCPAQENLWPIAVGETAGEVVAVHVHACESCRETVARLRTEIETVRVAANQSTEIAGFASNEETQSLLNDARPTPGKRLSPSVPATLGRYRLIDVLDEGGQGVVCRAVHAELARDVVIKLSKGSLPDEQRTALSDEGKRLAELEHPNVARVYDLDVADGRPYLVLQYIRGVNLRQYVKDRKFPPREIATLLAKVARALAAAHALGLVHQDIKPENIMVDDRDEPFVIDFGMARMRHAWADNAHDSGTISGTPAFMPPEQARGETQNIEPRTDVFALGAVLYFLLTGKAPFASDSIGQSLELAARCEFDRAVLENAGAPGALKRICMQAMSRNLSERQNSAAELAEQLERFGRPASLRKWLVAAAGLAALLIAVILIVANAQTSADHAAPLPAAANIQPEFAFRVRQEIEKGQFEEVELAEPASLLAGDKLMIDGKVPAGFQIVVFAWTAEGALQQMTDLEVTTANGVDRITYPAADRRVSLQASPGTHALFVCGRATGPIAFSEVEDAFRGEPAWPALPNPDSRVVITMHGVDLPPGHRFLGPETSIPEAGVMACARKVQQRLEKKFDFIQGVAFRFE